MNKKLGIAFAIIVAIGLAAVASVATPALADSTSGLAGIDKAQEHANENVICHLNTVEARLTGGIVVCPLG